MLLTPLIKRQLKIFAVVATVALGLTFVHYAKVPAMLGIGVYEVTADFADASGLYPKAAVTYRGVGVGVVTALEVSDDGAVATLRLDDDNRIPAGVVAELHATSAIGEQYVDLVDPPTARTARTARGGPILAEGSQIPRKRTVPMPQISPVLESVNRLLRSVPGAPTERVLEQLDEGLGGAGPDLGRFVGASGRLVGEAQRQIDATTSLIAALEPVLRSQVDLASRTATYAAASNRVTGALAADGAADLSAVVRSAPGALEEATRTVTGLQASLPTLVANLTTNAEVLHTYLPNVRQLLVVYPSLVARLQATVAGRKAYGDVQLDLRASVDDPPSCRTGYLPVQERRSPADLKVREVDRLAHCEIAPSDPSAVRGARNLPCPDSPRRGPTPAACGLVFPGAAGAGTGGEVAYDLAVGRGDGTADPTGVGRVDGTDDPQRGDDLWKILLLAPLGAR